MAHRGIATLATALTLCFLLLTYYDREFFPLHFYESLIYLVIVLMLFYFHERWAYMLGIVAPAAWLLITYATGVLGGAMRQMRQLLIAHHPSDQVSFLAGVIAALAVLLIIVSAYHWKREYAGLPHAWSTFFVSLVIVVIYYAILIYWFVRSLAREGRQFGTSG